jgi:maleylacetate reductase
MLLSTGMKAVDHAVERLTSKTANVYSDAVSTVALRMLRQGLPALRNDPSDSAVRSDIQYGVFMSMAGLASGVSTGLSHAMGHALGSFAGVAHGHTTCLLLPSVMRWIGDAIPERQGLICEALGENGSDSGAALQALIVSLGMPVRLRDVGVGRQDFEAISRRTLNDPLVANCPKPVTLESVMSIFEAAL